MEEQINEIAKHICNYCEETCGGECDTEGKPCETAMEEAEALYNAGYRKRKEGHWKRVYVICENNETVYYQHNDCEVNGSELFKKRYYFCPNCGAGMGGKTNGSKD